MPVRTAVLDSSIRIMRRWDTEHVQDIQGMSGRRIFRKSKQVPQRKIEQSSNKYQGEGVTCVRRYVFRLTSSSKERIGDDGGQHAP